MSPEQAEPAPERIGPASDVYSLGATLYEILTGHAPFDNKEKDLEALRRDVIGGKFRHPREVLGTVPRALEAIVLKAMAHNPADRYSSATALAKEIESWLADEPVGAWPEPASIRAGRWIRGHRTLVAAAAVALILTTAGLGVFVASQEQAKRRLQDSLQREGLAKQSAQGRFDLALEAIKAYETGISEDSVLKNEELKGLRSKLLKMALDFYKKLSARLKADAEPGAAPRVALAEAFARYALLSSKIGTIPDDAITACRNSIDLYDSLAHEDSDDTNRSRQAESYQTLGILLAATGRHQDAVKAYRRELDLYESLRHEHPEVATYRSGLAQVHLNLGVTLASSSTVTDFS
jgi:serine/threonine-protein kinase